MQAGIAHPLGGGKAIRVFGNSWTINAGSEETGPAVAVLEGTFKPGSGAQPHVQHQHEESFYVLEGEFSFRLGTQALTATAGRLCVCAA